MKLKVKSRIFERKRITMVSVHRTESEAVCKGVFYNSMLIILFLNIAEKYRRLKRKKGY